MRFVKKIAVTSEGEAAEKSIYDLDMEQIRKEDRRREGPCYLRNMERIQGFIWSFQWRGSRSAQDKNLFGLKTHLNVSVCHFLSIQIHLIILIIEKDRMEAGDMDEIIRLSGYMWNEEWDKEAIAEKLCKVMMILLFGVCLWTVAERPSGSIADEKEYSVASSFARNRAEEGEKQGMVLSAFFDSLDFSVPAPIPVSVVGQKALEGTADLEAQAVPAAAAECGPAVSVPVEGVQTEGVLAEEQEEVLPAMLTIHLHGNGGSPAMVTVTERADAVSSGGWSVPQRPGKVFDGWYLDTACTRPFEGVEAGTDILELYAGWRELEGFVSDDEGHILACTSGLAVVDGLLALPGIPACTGIEAGALADVADQITEIYIPANIRYIAPGALDGLPNLMYIEVEAGNPDYYSENGILYTAGGEIVGCPVWYTGE